jgi:RNA polymerase sigma factor (sigma-70 family)
MALLRREPPSQGWNKTSWSMIGRLGEAKVPAQSPAWDWLVATYERPMCTYIRSVLGRVRGRASEDDVRDLYQAFLTACLEKGWLSKAAPERGMFRAYAKTLLKRFVYQHLRAQSAQRRRPGEGRETYPLLDSDADALPEDEDSSEAFDREWVKVALERALERLRKERERDYEVVHDLRLTDGAGSEDLAARIGVHPKQLPVIRHRARKRLSHLFADELRKTVGDEKAFQEEWRALVAYMP